MPFNAWHEHDLDQHITALSSHEEHSCDLDEYICQGEFTRDCEHDSHIGVPVAKCFSCDFPFIKAFAREEQEAPFVFSLYQRIVGAYSIPSLQSRSSAARSRGPPQA
jgi:hypothetical protein